MKYLIHTILILTPLALLSQDPTIHWQNSIGGNENDILTSIQQLDGGGYIIGGTSTSDISGDKSEDHIETAAFPDAPDYWVVRLDHLGNVIWDNTIGGTKSDFLYTVIPTSDGGFICGGESSSDISDDKSEDLLGGLHSDFWVVKLNEDGVIEWENTIGGNNDERLLSILEMEDGGFILGGTSGSPPLLLTGKVPIWEETIIGS